MLFNALKAGKARLWSPPRVMILGLGLMEDSLMALDADLSSAATFFGPSVPESWPIGNKRPGVISLPMLTRLRVMPLVAELLLVRVL